MTIGLPPLFRAPLNAVSALWMGVTAAGVMIPASSQTPSSTHHGMNIRPRPRRPPRPVSLCTSMAQFGGRVVFETPPTVVPVSTPTTSSLPSVPSETRTLLSVTFESMIDISEPAVLAAVLIAPAMSIGSVSAGSTPNVIYAGLFRPLSTSCRATSAKPGTVAMSQPLGIHDDSSRPGPDVGAVGASIPLWHRRQETLDTCGRMPGSHLHTGSAAAVRRHVNPAANPV